MRKRTKVMGLVLIVGLISVVFQTSAQADEPNSVTVQSAYDDQSPDNLSVSLVATPATCDNKGGETGTSWTSEVTLTNLANETSLTYGVDSIALPAGQSAALTAFSTGTDNLEFQVPFVFDAEGAGTEFASINIAASSGGCDGSPDAVNCYMLNFTDQSLINDDGTYPAGTPVKLELALQYSDDKVELIEFEVSSDGGDVYDIVQSGSSNSYIFERFDKGTYMIKATLRNADGNALITTGDCDVQIIIGEGTYSGGQTDDDEDMVVVDDSDMVITVPGGGVVSSPEATQTGTTSAVELPATGKNTVALAMLSLALICLGAAFVLFGKRREVQAV